MCVEEAVVHL